MSSAECCPRFRTGRTTGQAGGIRRHRTRLFGSQKLADPHHHIIRIGPPAALAPLLYLLRKIGRGLTGEGRIGRSDTLTRGAVARSTCRKTARGVAKVIKTRGSPAPRGANFWIKWQAGVIERNRHALACIQSLRDPRHLRMIPLPLRIGLELPIKVSGIESSKSRNARAVALPLQTMTRKAGVGGPSPGPAVRDRSPGLTEAIERGSDWRVARLKCRRHQAKGKDAPRHSIKLTVRRNAGFHCLLLSLTIAACKPPPDDRQSMALGDPKKGLQAIERVACGSCHTIPGLKWPQGTVGPALTGLAERGLIAGKLPNRPDVVAAYIRNAPALVPGSAMPAMPVSEIEARDIASYLYEVGAQ